MTIKHIIFFTASSLPTSGEVTSINAAAALAGYTLAIRNGAAVNALATPEACDFVMGTPPPPYDVSMTYPVLVPGDIPTPTLIEEGDTIVLTDGAGVTLNCVLAVAAGVPTLTMPSTACILKSGVQKVMAAVSGSRTTGYTPTIVAGVPTVFVGS